MASIGVFIERYTVTNSEDMGALMRLGQVAQRMGHRLDVLFRPDMYKIPTYDAIYIRAMTDPLNSAFVAARLAELHGLRVIDDPNSILICCDKVNMYGHLQRQSVPMPDTEFLREGDVNAEAAAEILDRLGAPVVLKAPNSSFSMYVDRVSTPQDFLKVSRRFLRRADRIVAQRFVKSEFDWRVGVLGGRPIYVCRYLIPKRRWKILTYGESGKIYYGSTEAFELEKVDPALLETAVQACKAIGSGLYGVDLKQVGDRYVVIEVNDNPTIAQGEEDRKAPRLYEQLVSYLAGAW